MRKEWQNWRSPQEQTRGQVKYHCRGCLDIPWTITLSLDQGQGENGKTEKWAPLCRRKMTFHFSTIMATQGSSTLMLRSGAWTGGPWIHRSIGGGTLPSIWRCGNLDLQSGNLCREGRVPVGAGAVSQAVSFLVAGSGHRPSQVGHSLRVVMRSWCLLPFSFFLVMSQL
jgi:hypothetical protein